MTDDNYRDFSNVPVMWEPTEDSEKRMRSFMKRIEEKYSVKINDYWDIHKWSIHNVAEFWQEMWQLSGVIHSKPYDQVVDLNLPLSEARKWFAGAELNFAENLLRHRDDRIALILTGEDRETEKVTYAEMYEEVKLYAAALRKHGIKKGDRVSCFMSNRKEAVLAMLGATSLGAIWVGALPLMGPQAVLNRLKQVEPKILFTVDRFPHNREEHDMLPKLKEIANGLPSLEKIVIVASKPESNLKDIKDIKNSCFLHDFLEAGKKEDGSVPDIAFEQVPFTHPVFISFTSGTTGLPKALIHDCGILLCVFRDFWLQTNSQKQACWLSMSPVGWGTWNIWATMHFLGYTVVLFEGVPYFLSPTYLWDLVDEFHITTMFLTAAVIEDLEKKRYLPTERHHLSSLEIIMSGGSTVKPQSYDFVYKTFKKGIIFSSVYGSTELMGCSIVIDQTLKIYRGEITAPSLGIDIQCLDEEGKPVYGEAGELVFARPTPTFLSGIWGDDDRSRFKKAYFSKYPDKFSVGDIIIINPITKGIICVGRSDDTLKPKGCRFGSSEIYNVVDTIPEVIDSLCVSQYNKAKQERAVLFLKMRKGYQFNDDLVQKIRDAIAKELSIRHVPEVILETKDIPHNINGKKLEIIVKKIINKIPYNPETVFNSECLEYFKNIPELSDF